MADGSPDQGSRKIVDYEWECVSSETVTTKNV